MNQQFHDYYRQDQNGQGSFEQVMQAIKLTQSFNLNFGIICVLTDQNINYPETLFDFFVRQGIKNFNFGLAVMYNSNGQLESFSITSDQFKEFMIRLFEKWLAENNSEIKIPRLQDFLRGSLGQKTKCCEFNDWCQHYLMFDYDGIVRACCSLPQDWVVGNIMIRSLPEIFSSSEFSKRNI